MLDSTSTLPNTIDPYDWSDALVLVSCVKSKLDRRSPAKEMYISNWFRQARRVVETHGLEWRILSAKYGLLHPDTQIDPYEQTLRGQPIAGRRVWAEGVLEDLLALAQNSNRLIILAGANYREFLLPALMGAGIDFDVPMKHLRQGEQMQWLAGQ